MNNHLVFLKNIPLTILLSIIILVLLECALNIYYKFQDENSMEFYLSRVIEADAYKDIDWFSDYVDERQKSFEFQWRPYTYTKRKAYSGKYFNIDNEGHRKTWRSPAIETHALPKLKIWVFGGSTTWGYGSRDEFTISSMIAKILNKKGVNASVSNFGSSGYASTQEIIMLIRELQKKGNRPDVVVFYDGVNETMSACLHRMAGFGTREHRIADLFNMYVNNQTQFLYDTIMSKSSTIRFIKSKLSESTKKQEYINIQHNLRPNSEIISDKNLAQEIIDTYIENMEVAKALANHYSFKVIFYWQPSIFEKPQLTSYEKEIKNSVNTIESIRRLTHKALIASKVAENNPLTFHDISLIFNNVKDPVFLDWNHLGETGDRIIAEKISKDIFALPSTTRNKELKNDQDIY